MTAYTDWNVNQLTYDLVVETAKKYKSAARRDPGRFSELVLQAYDSHLVAEYGYPLKERAMDLFQQFRPEMFDKDGFIHEFADMVFDIDRCLSERVMRVVWRKVKRQPELQLNKNWGDLPKLTVDPQLELF